ncbi:MAG: crossover junction endodeoxyribonuclease RuvC [Alphaproteobacteria bacterium]|nr:crossover junction endodeoxyribonuclease RuvC [Alphaproteobacteria bacterium]
MRLLGLDPGLRRTGWGVIDALGDRLRYVGDGAIHSDSNLDTAGRLMQLFTGIAAVIREHRPDGAAVEETFLNKNPATTLKLGLARAVALLVPAQAGLRVAEYSAKTVKKSLVGTGGADKTQVQMMVRALLPGVDLHSADSADALAVAICHAHHGATERLWAAGRAS